MADLTSKELRIFMGNLIWLRQQHSLSKARMAKLLGISARTVNRIENGEFPSGLSVRVILHASSAFHVDAKYLFDANLPAFYRDLEK